jgi:hypothetical protein
MPLWTQSQTAIPTKEPEPDACCGVQLDFDRVKEIIKCESVEFVYLLNRKDGGSMTRRAP